MVDIVGLEPTKTLRSVRLQRTGFATHRYLTLYIQKYEKR